MQRIGMQQWFRDWHATLIHFDRKVAHAISSGSVWPVIGSTEEEDADPLATILAKADFQASTQRLFASLATKAATTLSAAGIRQAFAEVAPSISFSTIRRRILLGHISLSGLMSDVKRSPPTEDAEEAEMATGAAGRTQVEKISEFLELRKAQVNEFVAAVTVAEQARSEDRVVSVGPRCGVVVRFKNPRPSTSTNAALS
ncbi:unnamed protein product [Symbiodinium pilosum]|uniref:Uncharacterized protein n=1 Tax=Symbiodinium pilosum TaxID=2952 RepID=A0A812U0D0_SYMPI|nr:unnamed protein product [Symbiodinium pilosum]